MTTIHWLADFVVGPVNILMAILLLIMCGINRRARLRLAGAQGELDEKTAQIDIARAKLDQLIDRAQTRPRPVADDLILDAWSLTKSLINPELPTQPTTGDHDN